MASDTSRGKAGDTFQGDSSPNLHPDHMDRFKVLIRQYMEDLEADLMSEYEAAMSDLILENQNLRQKVSEDDVPGADEESRYGLHEMGGAIITEPSGPKLESQGTSEEPSGPKLVTQGTSEERPPSSVRDANSIKDITSVMRSFSDNTKDSRHKKRASRAITKRINDATPAPSHEDNSLKLLIKSFQFDMLCAAVVIVNAGTIGYSTSRSMTQQDDSEPVHLRNLEIAFVVFYMIEIALRCYAFRWSYVVGKDWHWNWFDIFLVVVSVILTVQSIVRILSVRTPVGNISFLRMFRVLKILRFLRIVRLLKFFKELRLILSLILGGMKTMIWAVLLVSIIQYIAAICFLHGCTSFLREEQDVSLPVRDAIDEYWCTLIRSMHSLFAACTGGLDWVDIADPLYEVGRLYYTLFVLYIGFFNLVILNTLTSIFLQTTMEHSETDHELMIQRELERKDEYIEFVQVFFDEMDDDGSGDITLEEFRNHLGNPRLRAFASAMDIAVEDAEQFFRILSTNGATRVDMDTFVVGCIKLKGNAKSVDLFAMYQLVKTVHRKIEHLQTEMCRIAVEFECRESTRKRSGSKIKNVFEGASQSGEATPWLQRSARSFAGASQPGEATSRLQRSAGTSADPTALSL